MPTYEYECAPCGVAYETMHAMDDAPALTCPRCGAALKRLVSAPRLNSYNFSSPTEAKYAKMSPQEEIARERELQRVYERVWLPPPVQHSPWD